MKFLTAGVVVLLLSFLPYIVQADLVPCGDSGEEMCQTCHVVDLVNGVIEWLIAILGTVAAILFMYAGFKLVTSGGNVSAKTDALRMINNLVIGYVIVLAGWLMVDTGLKALLTPGGGSDFGMWNEISCVVQPEARFTPWTGGVLPTSCLAIRGGEYDCSAAEATCVANGGTVTGASGPEVNCQYSGGVGARPPDLSAGGACAAGVISPPFGNMTGSAQCIIRAESACGARMVSRTDIMSIDGRAFSFGPMQINLTVHVLRGCSGYPAELRCLDAFSGRNYSARVINESLYQQCAQAAQNVDCNIKNGARIYREAGNSWRPWSTAAGCGLR